MKLPTQDLSAAGTQVGRSVIVTILLQRVTQGIEDADFGPRVPDWSLELHVSVVLDFVSCTEIVS